MAEDMKQAFAGLREGLSEAITVFIRGRCPHCSSRLVRGDWLIWCEKPGCGKYIGVKE